MAYGDQMEHSAFETAVIKAKETQDFSPVWNSFVNTHFFVQILQKNSGEKVTDFRFIVRQSPETRNEPTIFVTEVLERLRSEGEGKAIRMTGAELINKLNPNVGITTIIHDGGFTLPSGLVGWLRESMQTVE